MMQNALPAYAEANDMVVVYPQSANKGNPEGGKNAQRRRISALHPPFASALPTAN
jgi:hypothetical protein